MHAFGTPEAASAKKSGRFVTFAQDLQRKPRSRSMAAYASLPAAPGTLGDDDGGTEVVTPKKKQRKTAGVGVRSSGSIRGVWYVVETNVSARFVCTSFGKVRSKTPCYICVYACMFVLVCMLYVCMHECMKNVQVCTKYNTNSFVVCVCDWKFAASSYHQPPMVPPLLGHAESRTLATTTTKTKCITEGHCFSTSVGVCACVCVRAMVCSPSWWDLLSWLPRVCCCVVPHK